MEDNSQNSENEAKQKQRFSIQMGWLFFITLVVFGKLTMLYWVITTWVYIVLICIALYEILRDLVPEMTKEADKNAGLTQEPITVIGLCMHTYQCVLFISFGWSWTAAAAVIIGGYIIGRFGLPKF